MNKLYTTLIVILLTSNFLFSQSLEWAKQISGPLSETGTAIALDASGNVFTLGSFYGTVDFDPSDSTFNLTALGYGQDGADIFITKLDPDGNFQWAKQIGGTEGDVPRGMVVDADGNILVGGNIRGTVDLDPGPDTLNITTIGDDAFLLKLDTNGEFMWAKTWGGDIPYAHNILLGIVLDDAGNIILGGNFFGTNDLDPGPDTFELTASGSGDAYILKLDADGNFLWAVAFGGDDIYYSDFVASIAVDISGNIIAAGSFSGTVTNYNLQDDGSFYVKLDSSGNLIWAKQTTSTPKIYPSQVKLDAAGNAYILGRFSGTLDFDPGPGIFDLTANGDYDIFILKLDASGNFVWANSFGSDITGSSFLDVGYGLVLDNQGYLYTTGNYAGTVDFDPGPGELILTAVGYTGMFISKMDTDGNFVYAISFGNTPNSSNVGRSITTDNSGFIYCTGYFSDTTDFDPGSGVFNLIPAGNSDAFVLKLNDETLGISENSLLSLSLYPNPTNRSFTINLGREFTDVTVQISNILGQVISTQNYAYAKNIETEINTSEGGFNLAKILKTL